MNDTNELKVLYSAFSSANFYNKARLRLDEFKNSRYNKLYEVLTALKQEDFKAEEWEEWAREAGRRAKVSVDDLLDMTYCSSAYELEQMRFFNKQLEVEKLAESSKSMSPEDLMNSLRTLAQENITSKHRHEVDIAEYANSRYLDFLKKRKEKETGLYSGFMLFDKIVGLERGNLCTLGARPSIGKSALALNLAYSWIQFGFNVFYASLEMSIEELTHRLFASITGINTTKFKYGNVDEARIKLALSELNSAKGKLNMAFLPGATMDEILQSASAKNPDIVILDHIDLVRDTVKNENEAYLIAQKTGALKAFAGQKECAVLCLSQFNREAKGDFPELHQLRGSGAKEQDSDVVLILHRSLDPDSVDSKRATLRVAKNRSGQVGDILLEFKPEITTFYESK